MFRKRILVLALTLQRKHSSFLLSMLLAGFFLDALYLAGEVFSYSQFVEQFY